MKITREKLLQDAFVLFMQHNYEKVSYTMLTRAIGLSKAGMSYYYRTKQELFMAVVDRYVFNVHDADAKFTPAATFAEFLDNFLENVRHTMEWYVTILKKSESPEQTGRTAFSNFFSFMPQILHYYPGADVRIQVFWQRFLTSWRHAVAAAIESGEFKPDTDIEQTADMFNNVYLGMSFMKSFSTGLNVDELKRSFEYIYERIKA